MAFCRWDIIAEKFGFMLIFGDVVFIPFTFSIQASAYLNIIALRLFRDLKFEGDLVDQKSSIKQLKYYSF